MDNPSDDELVIQVNQGKLKGIKKKSEFSQVEYFSFLGIPFALPPVGKLRFKPPVKGEKWSGVLDAAKERSPCLQYSFYTNQILGDEDCLYLYIHTPEIPRRITKPKAVVVGFHQGGFNCGSGSSDHHGSPDYLIHHDIIYVTFNFRLHALGFLNLGIEECSGNAGLKDMVLALKWINENISAFGGDPNNVTALASSSTAAALHHLMLFSHLKGLIHKVIMLGCCGFSDPCSYQTNGPELAFKFAKLLGCRSSNPHVVHKFLMAQNQYEILNAQGIFRGQIILENPGKFSMSPFFMSIEIECEHAVITQSPKNLMHSIEPLPFLFGRCEHEAILMFYNEHIKSVKNDLLNVVKKNLWQFEIDDETLLEITKRIKRFYFNEDKSFEDLSLDAEKFYQDLWYFEFYPSFINLIAEKQSTPALFLYNFTYDGELNYQKKTFLPKLFCSANALKSAVHADDSYYWMAGFYSQVPEKERKMVNRMGSFLTNFAKTGNPNDQTSDFYWEPYTLNNPCYMQFDDPLKMVLGRFHEERMKFWEKISILLKKSSKEKENKY